MRFPPDLLAPWPGNAAREIPGKAEGRDPTWSARIDDIDHRDFERDEFRTRFGNKSKSLMARPECCARAFAAATWIVAFR